MVVGALAHPVEAQVYQITPVNLSVSGTSFTGTITTDGTLGPLAPSNVVDWEIGVSGPIAFTITPANSGLNETVFSLVSATADDLRVTFPDGNLQFNLLAPFTATVPACSSCEEGAVQLFRSDYGRNAQGFFLQDVVDDDPFIDDFEGPVVTSGAMDYLAATAVPEPPRPWLAATALAALAARRLFGRGAPAIRISD
jgi:hypothetical protein